MEKLLRLSCKYDIECLMEKYAQAKADKVVNYSLACLEEEYESDSYKNYKKLEKKEVIISVDLLYSFITHYKNSVRGEARQQFDDIKQTMIEKINKMNLNNFLGE